MYFFWGSNLFRVYNQKSKTFNNRTCLGEPPGGFCDVSCHFIFVSSFCCCSSFVNVLHSHFLFGIIPHPSVDYRRGCYTPFYTFSPAHCRVIHDTFIFNHSVIFLPRALRFWVGIFYPQVFFTLHSFPAFWAQPAFIKACLGAGSYFLKFAEPHTDPRNTGPANLFVWFTVIHNLLYILNLYLYMPILQKFLLVVKTLIKNIDQQPDYSAAIKI